MTICLGIGAIVWVSILACHTCYLKGFQDGRADAYQQVYSSNRRVGCGPS